MTQHPFGRRAALASGALASGALALLAAPTAWAQGTGARRGLADTTREVNAGTVGMITGGVDGTYIRIAADLAAVLDEGEYLRVLPVIGKGSLQNISDLLYLRGIDLAIVQSDVLAAATRDRLFPGMTQLVQYVAKLYDEEVHVLARRDIERVEDLAGQAVNVDLRGSGTAMTASLIFGSLGIDIRAVHAPQDLALERLRRGEIAALVYVAGKPARLFSGVRAEEGLHLLSLPLAPQLLETYLPAPIEHADYPALIAENSSVQTMAVGAVLAVYAWKAGTERHGKLVRFLERFNQKFPALLQPPRHPKWREVNLTAQVPGWTRFNP
ncbi:TAXI family TRAP transporter solute-binding subunit [Teichococcus oryzae]|uniref:TAXI family TRAP transporter solute-binding subunit n=1 Tax=Teichococcus oryzae TaxID=1608942 RepID=A0A5B2TGB1_9PROT|nr:TAXI family TRAP transporter solute-binding subunit [Pseudoroseomonas oryzae]KAA2213035.1 TAXI family TRAP transporter solute-binding subunit [Pseudoroseomonas oryzae]